MIHWAGLTDEQKTALFMEQDDIEQDAVERGVRRFREEIAKKQASQWPGVRRLVVEVLPDVMDGIEEARLQFEKGRGFRNGGAWGLQFMVLDSDTLGLVTLSALFDKLTMHDTTAISYADAISSIGRAVEAEWHMYVLKTEAPRLKRVMDRKVKKWTPRALRTARQRLGVLGKMWPRSMRRHVGAKLLEIVHDRTDLLVSRRIRSPGSRHFMNALQFRPHVMEAIMKTHDASEIQRPFMPLMVVPPKDWSPDTNGGYQFLSMYTPMVRSRLDDDASSTVHGPAVYETVNYLQRTEWRVNTFVLDTMEKVWSAGGGWAGLPSGSIKTPPPYPKDGTKDEVSQWKKVASKIHGENARVVGTRYLFLTTLALAQQFRDRVFYFPYRYDFRGRIYPTTTGLQPQGNDVARGLLQFHESVPLGDDGEYWLLVAYANACGVDKVSFDERVAWARKRLAPLTRAEHFDPFEGKHLWADADEPWQALAYVHDLWRAWNHGGPAEDYPSRVVVGMDGSNSGLQHFAAMLRDSHAASLVNLAPSPKPSDFYTIVSDSALRLIRDDVRSGVSEDTTVKGLPQQWLDHWQGRKTTKRPGMTFTYGVTLQGMGEALIADGFANWADDPRAAVQYVSKKIWAAIEENVTSAAGAMEWLRACANCFNHRNLLMSWTTPDGFHVASPYGSPPYVRVKCMGCEVHFADPDPDAPVRIYKQRNSSAPNFVHSYDGTHLRMTALACRDRGVSSLRVVHDDFGVHAGQVAVLNRAVREAFVSLYRDNALEALRQHTISKTGIDPGPPPEMGDFDIEQVLDSDYFFS